MEIQRIFREAQVAGACDQNGLDIIKNSRSIDDLIALLKSPQGIEFCMTRAFPSKEMLGQFTRALQINNVFHEGKHTVKNPRLLLAFGGEINIEVDGFTVTEVYATNNAVINIKAKDNAYVSVETHKESNSKSISLDKSKVIEFDKSDREAKKIGKLGEIINGG